MSNKRTNTFGPPTDSETEPEVIIRRGTRTRSRSPDFRFNFTTLHPTTPTTPTTPIVVDLTIPTPTIVVDLTLPDPPIFVDLTGPDANEPLVVDPQWVELSDLSDDELSLASTLILPPHIRKTPLTIEEQIRSAVPLSKLPPVNTGRFYSCFDLSLRTKYWHTTTTSSPNFAECNVKTVTLVGNPRWLHPNFYVVPWCVYTKYMHKLYLECPSTRWRPVTRGMSIIFRNALKYSAPNSGIPQSIKLYLGTDMEEEVSSDGSDQSVTITSEDDPENETLFLFRFWSTRFAPHNFSTHVLESDVDEESLAKIDEIMAL